MTTEPETTQTTVRLPDVLLHRLQEAADERMIGRSKLLEVLIEDGLSRLRRRGLAGRLAGRRRVSTENDPAPREMIEAYAALVMGLVAVAEDPADENGSRLLDALEDVEVDDLRPLLYCSIVAIAGLRAQRAGHGLVVPGQ